MKMYSIELTKTQYAQSTPFPSIGSKPKKGAGWDISIYLLAFQFFFFPY